MITGRLPVKRAAGRYRKPLMDFPSNVFQCTSCASEKLSGFKPPVSLLVQRSTFPVATSTEYTSEGEREPVTPKARSRPLGCHFTPKISPAGSLGAGFSFPVLV